MNTTTENTITWRSLLVTDASDGRQQQTLGRYMDTANCDDLRGMRCAVNELGDTKIDEWAGCFISAEDETPDWDTPCVPVDWEGFASALNAARQRVEEE